MTSWYYINVDREGEEIECFCKLTKDEYNFLSYICRFQMIGDDNKTCFIWNIENIESDTDIEEENADVIKNILSTRPLFDDGYDKLHEIEINQDGGGDYTCFCKLSTMEYRLLNKIGHKLVSCEGCCSGNNPCEFYHGISINKLKQIDENTARILYEIKYDSINSKIMRSLLNGLRIGENMHTKMRVGY